MCIRDRRHPAIELLSDEHGRCVGAILYDLEKRSLVLVHAKAVVLATGGSGRLHLQGFATSNHYGATADGLVIAYRIGAKLRQRKTCRQMVQPLAVCIGQDGAVGYEGWIGLHDGLPIRQGTKNRQTGDVHRTLAEPLIEWA